MLLQAMPEFAAAQRLDAWERSFKDVYGAPSGDSGSDEQLISRVFDFGRFNLYGAFDVPTTLREFQELAQYLASLGILVDAHADVGSW